MLDSPRNQSLSRMNGAGLSFRVFSRISWFTPWSRASRNIWGSDRLGFGEFRDFLDPRVPFRLVVVNRFEPEIRTAVAQPDRRRGEPFGIVLDLCYLGPELCGQVIAAGRAAHQFGDIFRLIHNRIVTPGDRLAHHFMSINGRRRGIQQDNCLRSYVHVLK